MGYSGTRNRKGGKQLRPPYPTAPHLDSTHSHAKDAMKTAAWVFGQIRRGLTGQVGRATVSDNGAVAGAAIARMSPVTRGTAAGAL